MPSTIHLKYRLLRVALDCWRRSQTPVMIAVDDWNALYWRTAYHEWLNNKHRKRVDADDVRLVAALRALMEGPPPPPSADGVAPCLRLLGATSRGSSISESLRVPRPQGSLRMVRMCLKASVLVQSNTSGFGVSCYSK